MIELQHDKTNKMACAPLKLENSWGSYSNLNVLTTNISFRIQNTASPKTYSVLKKNKKTTNKSLPTDNPTLFSHEIGIFLSLMLLDILIIRVFFTVVARSVDTAHDKLTMATDLIFLWQIGESIKELIEKELLIYRLRGCETLNQHNFLICQCHTNVLSYI